MNPMLIQAGLSAIPAAFQFINGIKQNRLANKMNPIRPTYNVPGAINEATSLARNSANADMAGYGQAVGNLQASTANVVRSAQNAGSGNNILATLAAANANETNGMNNLAVQNASFRQQGQRNLQSQLGLLGTYQDKAWDYNQKQKFDEEAAAKAALKEGALNNMNNALGGLAGAAVTANNPLLKGGTTGNTRGATPWSSETDPLYDDYAEYQKFKKMRESGQYPV